MRELHFFTAKDHIQLPGPFSARVTTQNVQDIRRGVDEWIEHNNITDCETSPFKTHCFGERISGYEAPTDGFYNELDALQFKLVFGDQFDNSVYDASEDE